MPNRYSPPSQSRLLDRLDGDETRRQGLVLRQQGLDERSRHDQVAEELQRQHMRTIRAQQALKLMEQMRNMQLAEQQATAIAEATGKMQKLDPQSPTYSSDLLQIKQTHPMAWYDSKNGLEKIVLSHEEMLNKVHQQWTEGEKQKDLLKYQEDVRKAAQDKAQAFVDQNKMHPETVKVGDITYHADKNQMQAKAQERYAQLAGDIATYRSQYTDPKNPETNKAQALLQGALAEKVALETQFPDLKIAPKISPSAVSPTPATDAATAIVTPASPTVAPTMQDQAITWAKANPADPRAQKILTFHGVAPEAAAPIAIVPEEVVPAPVAPSSVPEEEIVVDPLANQPTVTP